MGANNNGRSYYSDDANSRLNQATPNLWTQYFGTKEEQEKAAKEAEAAAEQAAQTETGTHTLYAQHAAQAAEAGSEDAGAQGGAETAQSAAAVNAAKPASPAPSAAAVEAVEAISSAMNQGKATPGANAPRSTEEEVADLFPPEPEQDPDAAFSDGASTTFLLRDYNEDAVRQKQQDLANQIYLARRNNQPLPTEAPANPYDDADEESEAQGGTATGVRRHFSRENDTFPDVNDKPFNIFSGSNNAAIIKIVAIVAVVILAVVLLTVAVKSCTAEPEAAPETPIVSGATTTGTSNASNTTGGDNAAGTSGTDKGSDAASPDSNTASNSGSDTNADTASSGSNTSSDTGSSDSNADASDVSNTDQDAAE